MATTTINGELVLDQTSGLQTGADGDDVRIDVTAGDISSANLAADFVSYLNNLTLTQAQLDYANDVEAARQIDLVTVTPSANEEIAVLQFGSLTNEPVMLDPSTPMTTLDGDALYMTTVAGGSGVLVHTQAGDEVAVFWIVPNSDNTKATIEMVSFEALAHPDTASPDDRVDFGDVLKIRVLAETNTPIGNDINVDDDGPSFGDHGTVPGLTTDDTDIAGPSTDSADFSDVFTPDFGTDGPAETDDITYSLGVKGTAPDSGLDDTLSGDNILLRLAADGDVEGYLQNSTTTVAFVISVDEDTGQVTLTQNRAIVHDDPADPNEVGTFAAKLISADLVTLKVTITDGDGDTAEDTADIGGAFSFEDDGPTISRNSVQAPALTTDDTDISVSTDPADFSVLFNHNFGKDGFKDVTHDSVQDDDAIVYTLDVKSPAVESGLVDTVSGDKILLRLALNGDVEGYLQNSTTTVAFAISIDGATGEVTLTQNRAVVHNDPSDPVESGASAAKLSLADLVKLTATITDGDGDTAQATANIGLSFNFEDDGPRITKPFDGDQTGAVGTHEVLANTVGASATGDFGYTLGNDGHNAAFYAGGGSDFVDVNNSLAGTQISLSGFVNNGQTAITQAVATLASESTNTATFNYSFHFDKDPLTNGVQDATAGGTLTFDKAAGTYTITLSDIVDGYSFSVLHTNELQAKAPPGNTGHPQIVVTQLDLNDGTTDTNGFYVQFTANSNPSGSPFGFTDLAGAGDGPPIAGDTTYNPNQFVTSNFEDWVSATQSSNGVAGDTIQKGELLTLRFFNENILGDVDPNGPGGGTEKLTPTDAVDGLALKFDGIGNAEDLILVLNLVNYGSDGVLGGTGTAADTFATKSIYVENQDMYKLSNGGVPSPYNTEFTLDQNDALVIIEKNDYNNFNAVTGQLAENWQIQGVQIMQSGNGLGGQAINLNRGIDNPLTAAQEGASTGAASGTGGGALQNWEATDNDVLKIVDIGFVEASSGQLDANLNFAFQIKDGDGDVTPTDPAHLLVDIPA